ncbi:MAG: hypothetical protein IT379_12280 [Deltaproteobacteria bacterium]|nr:hypothetical protein [Deltaproteobacteria bacterium]
MVLLAGCTLARRPSARYTRALPFVELAFDDPVPSIATLSRWSRDLPKSLVRAIVAPRSAVVSPRGPLRRDPALDRSVRWWLDAASTLGAQALVLATPTDLSPGPRDREVLRSYLASVVPADPTVWVAWQPAGVWTGDETIEEAARNGVVPIVDPIEDDVPPATRGYARIGSLGARPRLTPTLLEQIVETYSAHELALVALRTDQAFAEARALDALARSVQAP